MSEQPLILHRYRLAFARGPELRYVSHLDMGLVWERTMRRARLPVAFSQGYSPRPRFHMAAALALGFTSRCELADLWLNEYLTPDELLNRLQTSAPPGMHLQSVDEVELALPALQTQVCQAEYVAVLIELPEVYNLEKAVDTLIMAESLPRVRRDKEYDLRPLIDSLVILPQSAPDGYPALHMRLAAREGATGRPEEVLSALSLDPTTARVEKVRLYLE
jgi:radical SAM-linked protein